MNELPITHPWLALASTPLLLADTLALALGLGLFVAAVTVRYRDLQQVVTNLQLAFASVASRPSEDDEAARQPAQEQSEGPAQDADG